MRKRAPLAVMGAVAAFMVCEPVPGTDQGAALAAAAEPLRVGIAPDYPPFTVLDGHDQPAGFAMDLVDAVSGVMDREVAIRTRPWHALLRDMRAGRLDVLPVVGISPTRATYLDFTIPVATGQGAVFVADGGPALRGEADLAGLRIGVMREEIVHDRARGRAWSTALVPFPGLEGAFRCLAERRCDAVVAPRLQGVMLARRLGLSEVIRPADLVLEDFALDYAMAVRKGDYALLARLNDGLAVVLADGTLRRLNARWLPPVHADPGVPLLPVLLAGGAGLLLFGTVVAVLVRRQRNLHRVATRRHQDLRRERERRRSADAEAAAILRVLPDMVLRLDADGRYVSGHDPGGLAGMPVEDMLGQVIEEVLPEDIAVRLRVSLALVADTGDIQTLDYDLTLPEVGHRWFQARLAPFSTGGAVMVVRDVTAARRRADQLARAAAAIASASAAKSRFLATMSHELRTPLNAIIGFSQMMDEEVFGPLGASQYQGYARDIQSAGQSLLTLISGVMDMAQVESGRMILTETEVDLGAVAAHRVALARPGAVAIDARVDMEPPAAPVIVRADAGLVQRMVESLVSNAVRFSPGGSVRVAVGRLESGASEVVVADTGMGMTEDQLAHLGEPFYQASPLVARDSGGFGLGVTLVREMIALHGGELRYDSRPGAGTMARLLFPPERSVTVAPDGRHLRVVH
ncbi:transporter substrate-binding domain-containing protein [Roseospira visakhapatnamensis]|uniref:histidine kinase n=1 Tax=Roseospira visakhapatnamensis TaxID=390880 RepID=A0A7W6WB74_9PROT|nr:signal transduction histidine kinase [Roseospira visakhapatnamensis]